MGKVERGRRKSDTMKAESNGGLWHWILILVVIILAIDVLKMIL